MLDDLWDRLHAEFRNEIRRYKGPVEEFIQQYSPDVHLIGRVFFHLVENKKSDRPFAFFATYSSGLNRRGRSRQLPLKQALQEYEKDGNELFDLLSTVHRAAKESGLIERLLESGDLFHPLDWTAKEAYAFLREIPLYEQSGILCRIPDWWKGASSSLHVSISIGDSRPSMVGMDALLSFDIGLHIADEPVSLEEVRRLVESAEGLALINNRWVTVDPAKLQQTLDAYEKASELVHGRAYVPRCAPSSNESGRRYSIAPGAMQQSPLPAANGWNRSWRRCGTRP